MLVFADSYAKSHEEESPIKSMAQSSTKKIEEQERPKENRIETKAYTYACAKKEMQEKVIYRLQIFNIMTLVD